MSQPLRYPVEPFVHRQNGSHLPQHNGYYGNDAPYMNGHNGFFPPYSNGYSVHGLMTEPSVFYPQAPPPIVPSEGPPDGMSHHTNMIPPPPPPPHYCQPGDYQCYHGHQYPVSNMYYHPPVQQQYPVHVPRPTGLAASQPAPVHLRRTSAFEADDPEAKLFVGDLPVNMNKKDLINALEGTFRQFGECKVNVNYKAKCGPNGVITLPTGWIQYKNMFEAAMALDVAKEQRFSIRGRPMRIDQADAKRICRMWPTRDYATPSLDEFKRAIRQFIEHVGRKSGNRVLYHVSNSIEMVEKHQPYDSKVPSVGVMFRWVEDANYSVRNLPKFNYEFQLKIEHVNSGTPGWREGPARLRDLDALMLETGNRWQEKLEISRRRLQTKGQNAPGGKMARYPERISKNFIPRSILEHSRLEKNVFDSDPDSYDSLARFDVHLENPTSRARAINSKKMGLGIGKSNGYCNGNENHPTIGEVSHQTNGAASHQINGKTNHQANSEASHQTKDAGTDN